MAMFQIITQEGWTEFVVEVLRMIDDRMVPFVAIYFVAYHLFVTLVNKIFLVFKKFLDCFELIRSRNFGQFRNGRRIEKS